MSTEAGHGVGASVLTSVVTAFVALWPGEAAIAYAEKLFSVLVLAAVAETGRRLVAHWFDRRRK